MAHQMITVGIKALNEERHIAVSIESALAAVAPFKGHVVLADSGSTDRTIEIASRYPIKIVQLSDFAERCCGAGAQLAFQHSDGDYFYLLDGDMVLHPDFLAVGIKLLETDGELAAVGGAVIEKNIANEDFAIRAHHAARSTSKNFRYVDRLDCGGLYRTEAIASVAYFADSNLHSFEEFELGARLKTKGWKLVRIADPAVDHYGHLAGGYRLLRRRFQSGYAGGAGQVLRSAIGKPQIFNVLFQLSHLPLTIAVVGWWVSMAIFITSFPLMAIVTLAIPVLFLIIRRNSFKLGIYSFVSWNISAFAIILGTMKSRRSPTVELKSKVIIDCSDRIRKTE